MIRNYFTVAIRHLRRHPLFTAINILCLAIGITFSMIIGLYVLDQKNINHQLKNAENQYFLKSKWKEKDLGLDITSISPLAKTIKEEYPKLVANYFRYNPVTNTVSAGDKHFKEDIAIGDTTLVSMYGFPLLYGDKNNAFPDNSSAVITATMALKLFATTDAIGKTISIQTTVAGASQDYKVSAVLKDISYNTVTHLLGNTYSVYVPTTGNRYFQTTDVSLDWDHTNYVSFIELQPGTRPESLTGPLQQLLKKNSADFVWKNLTPELAPVKDYYLKDNNGAVMKMITVLSLTAVFILLMVVINFVNINIGTSTYRLKEIGLRKIFGSVRRQLIWQFLTEAWVLSFIAGIISIIFYQLLIPVFSLVLHTSFQPFWHFDISHYTLLFILILFIGFISGVYPAFALSVTNMVNAVKGKINSTRGSLSLKRILLIVQFSLASIVFICTLNLSKQVAYIFNRDTGYNKEQLLVITALPKQWDSAGVMKMESIKQGMLQLSSVKSATLAFDLPDGKPAGRFVLYPPGTSDLSKAVNTFVSNADEDYAKTFGIQIKAGSFFQDNKTGIVLNETAVNMLGLSLQDCIGRTIATPGGPITIRGIVKDFNFSSMQEAIGPIGFVHISSQNTYRYLTVKLNTAEMARTVTDIRNLWKKFSPNAPFDFNFMDQKFAALYKSELQLQKAAGIAAGLNFLIILLGIFGVVAFTLTKRTKEIAVRKVLGAGARNIILLFINEYAVLIGVSTIIAWPVAYLLTYQWLLGFAYRVNQNIGNYMMVLAIVSVTAFILIILQCFKVAVTNPVKSLRTE